MPVRNPPINMESLFSNRGVAYQLMINKKLQSIPRLGFFSVTNLVGEWDQRQVDDYMTQGNLTFQIVKGLDIASGFHVTSVGGFRPTASLMYAYARPDFLLVLSPRADLMEYGAIEGLALMEYKPKLNDEWRVYTRLQGLYAHTPKPDIHARSYIMLSAGLSYKEFNFGVGSNFDWYGPMKMNKNSYGAFISMQLF